MFLGLPDPDLPVFCRDPDPSINKQKTVRKTLICRFFDFFSDILSMKTVANVPSTVIKQTKTLKKPIFPSRIPDPHQRI
jgi:hypothetical protein